MATVTRRTREWLRGSLAGAAFQVVQGSAAGRLAAAAVGILAAGRLGIGEFGAFTYGLATASLLSGIGLLAVPTLLTRDIAQCEDARQRGMLLAAAVAFVGLTSTVVSIVGVFVAQTASSAELRGLLHPVAWVGIGFYSVANAHTTVLLAYLQGSSQFSAWRSLSISRSVAGTAALFASLVGWASPTAALVALGVSETVVAVLGSVRLSQHYSAPAMGRWSVLLRQGRNSAGPAAASISILLSSWAVQTVLLRQPAGVALVGALGTAYRVAQLGAFLPSAYVSAATPQILMSGARGPSPSERRLEAFGLLGATCAASATIVVCPLIPLLGEGYALAVVPSIVLATWIVPSTGNVLAGQIALSRHLSRAWWLSDLWLALVLAAVGWALVGSWGASGIAVATLLATTSSWLGLRIYLGLVDSRGTDRVSRASAGGSEVP